nr:uncharacterized protein LOC111421253 [Onthophagus taurus]
MTTTQSTVVNFSIKDIIDRIERIKVVNNIVEDLKDTIIFPTEKNVAIGEEHTINYNDFSNKYIGEIVEEALKDVCKGMEDLRISVKAASWNFVTKNEAEEEKEPDLDNENDDLYHCDMDSDIECDNDNQEGNNMFQNFLAENQIDSVDFDPDSNNKKRANINMSLGGSNIKDYSDKVNEVTPDNQYVQIDLGKERTAVIKKSTYCWLLEEEKGRVNADRLRRFFGLKKRTRSKTSNSTSRKTLGKKPKAKS